MNICIFCAFITSEMARSKPSTMIRVDDSIAERATAHAKVMGWSFSKFGEHAVELLCGMIEDPAKRTVPDIVVMMDAKKQPKPFLSYKDVLAPPSARAAEKAPKKSSA